MSGTDCITITTLVAVDPETAFALFTEDVDSWWRQGPKYRFDLKRTGVMRFEPRVGGRFLEVFDDATDDHYEVGRIRAWEPGERLVFEFRPRAFGPDEVTEVEVRFEPAPGGTRVTVDHRGWDALAADHPARHGLTGGAFTSMIGLWWSDQLLGVRYRAKG